MDLKSLAQLGRVEKEVEFNSDFKIKLHTLSVVEQQKALLAIPDEMKDESARLLQLQMTILVWATDSINGETVPREKLAELYSNLQPAVLSGLFLKYMELKGDQDNILDQLKKN